MSEFVEFDKIARLSRGCVITEKIDGTNGQVLIWDPAVPSEMTTDDVPCLGEINGLRIAAGSRSRYIVPWEDNYGFAAWVRLNALDLMALGPGRHFGEWWGAGIQRRYGLGEKRFSLFNVGRWVETWRGPDGDQTRAPLGEKQEYAPACCHVVPVLYVGRFATDAVDGALLALKGRGSSAAPGFMKPEGVVVWHEAARVLFKKTIEKDEAPKGRVA